MADISDSSFDAIVVGAGPGGSSCAAYLGREGVKVLLLDKASFPRDKTCGDAVSGKSMRVMRELGLVEGLEKARHGKITGVLFSSPDRHVASINFHKKDPNRPGGSGYCVRRMDTDRLLFEAAKKTKNVTTKEKFQVTGVLMEGGRAVGVKGIDTANREAGERQFRAKVVVGADGVNSAVVREVLGEKEAKLDPAHSCDAVRGYYRGIGGLTDKIEIHFLKSCMPGYFWIFPLEDGHANVGLGILSEDLQKSMKNGGKNLLTIFNDAIANDPMISERFRGAKLVEGTLTGWRLPFGSRRRKVAGEGWVLVGDAASLVDPFSGEGVGNATLSGRLAAQAISDALKEGGATAEALGKYETMLWAEIGSEMKTSHTMQRLGRFHWLLNRVVAKAERSEEFREVLSSSLANEEAKKKFRSPLFYAWLLFSP